MFLSLKDIEQKIGRIKNKKWGPREIDLDLLIYDSIVYEDKYITVPHKGITERDFVIIPLLEIEPELFHPALKKKISDIYNDISEKYVIRKTEDKL